MAWDWIESAKIAWTTFKASKAYIKRYGEAPRIAELVDLQTELANAVEERLRLTRELASERERRFALEQDAAQPALLPLDALEMRNNAYWRRQPIEGGHNGPWCTRCAELRVGQLTLRRAGEHGQCPECKAWYHNVWPLDTGPTSPWRPQPYRTPRWIDPNR